MKKPWYIEVKADKFLNWYSSLGGGKGVAKAAAFYPFVYTKSDLNTKMRPYFINHELIHLAQQKELLFVGAFLNQVFESFWLFVWKGKRGLDLYLSMSMENEAYDNMFNLEYLETRKPYANFRSYWNKKSVIWKEYLKKVLETEGFPIVYEWTDAPSTDYAEHAHQGKVTFFVTKGSLELFGGIQKKLVAGERFDVPVGVLHTAKVGSEGCAYVVGQEIAGIA